MENCSSKSTSVLYKHHRANVTCSNYKIIKFPNKGWDCEIQQVQQHNNSSAAWHRLGVLNPRHSFTKIKFMAPATHFRNHFSLYKISEQSSTSVFIISTLHPRFVGLLCLLFLPNTSDSSCSRGLITFSCCSTITVSGAVLYTCELLISSHCLFISLFSFLFSVHLQIHFPFVSVISVEALSHCTDVRLSVHPNFSENTFPLF